MKIKAIKNIPIFNSYMGFNPEVQRELNAGKSVSVKSIPEQAKDYVKEVKSKGDK